MKLLKFDNHVAAAECIKSRRYSTGQSMFYQTSERGCDPIVSVFDGGMVISASLVINVIS